METYLPHKFFSKQREKLSMLTLNHTYGFTYLMGSWSTSNMD